jgi:hypothetical protein
MLSLAIDDLGKAGGHTCRGQHYLTLLTGLERIVVANGHTASKGHILDDNFSRLISKPLTLKNIYNSKVARAGD